ncbi:hypothetical protein Aduo_015950 [Ancylostoma duodenale]
MRSERHTGLGTHRRCGASETQDSAPAGDAERATRQDSATAGNAARAKTQDSATAGNAARAKRQDSATAGNAARAKRQDSATAGSAARAKTRRMITEAGDSVSAVLSYESKRDLRVKLYIHITYSYRHVGAVV